MGKTNPPKSDKQTFSDPLSLGFFPELIKKYGARTILLAAFLWVLFKFSTDDQKHNFFDTWLLLKPENPSPLVFLIVCLVLALVVQFISFRTIHKINRQQIKRLTDELKHYQKPFNP